MSRVGLDPDGFRAPLTDPAPGDLAEPRAPLTTGPDLVGAAP
ncbi:hypothetical protein ACFW6C_02650 [Streptomyces fungicidicus]|nr:hypothetical protein [Streptomyces sp. NA02536]